VTGFRLRVQQTVDLAPWGEWSNHVFFLCHHPGEGSGLI